MQYSCRLSCENTKYTNRKSHRRIKKEKSHLLICLVFSIWPHVLIHITPDSFSGKAFWEELLIHPWQCAAMMSWHLASIASRRDIWSCERWSKPLRLQVEKNSSMGLRKLLNGVEERGVRGKEKGHHPQMAVKPGCDCTGMVECHIVPCVHIYWQVISHLSPFCLWHLSFIQVF